MKHGDTSAKHPACADPEANTVLLALANVLVS